MSTKQKVKKIWNIATAILVGLVVLVAVAFVALQIFGYSPYTVLSGSMEPEYHVGALIYVDRFEGDDYKELQVGDVITYSKSDNTIVTHRITQILPDETDPNVVRYFTKGDANDVEDPVSVHYKNIIGTPVFQIPYLGYVAQYIQNPPGTYVAIALGVLLLALVFLPDLLFPEEKKKKETDPES